MISVNNDLFFIFYYVGFFWVFFFFISTCTFSQVLCSCLTRQHFHGYMRPLLVTIQESHYWRFPPSAFPYFILHCVGADGIRYRGLRTNPLAKILKYRTALSKQRKSGLLILNWTKATQCTTNQKENWMVFFPALCLIEDFKFSEITHSHAFSVECVGEHGSH